MNVPAISPVSRGGQESVSSRHSPELVRAVGEVNASGVLGDQRELNFGMDPRSRRPVIRIVDRRTGEVVGQAPPEYVLELARDLADSAKG